MSIIERTVWTDQARNASVLSVSVSGLTLTVGAGSFKREGQDYVLAEDEEWEATNRPTKADASGYLVIEKATGQVGVFVDDVVHDGVDVPYVFNGSPFKVLQTLFHMDIPANTADLASVDVTVFCLRDRAEKPEEES